MTSVKSHMDYFSKYSFVPDWKSSSVPDWKSSSVQKCLYYFMLQMKMFLPDGLCGYVHVVIVPRVHSQKISL